MLVMWIGERITEYGVANGISLIIFLGIISTAGLTIVRCFTQAFGLGEFGGKADLSVFWEVLGFVLLSLVEFAAIVTFVLSEIKVPF